MTVAHRKGVTYSDHPQNHIEKHGIVRSKPGAYARARLCP